MAQVVVEMSGDEAKLWRSYQRIIDQSTKLEGKTKETKKAHDDAFGDIAMSKMSGYLAGIVSITQGLSVFKQMLTEVQAKGEELAARQRADMAQTGPLAQLAMGDKARMRQLLAGRAASYAQGAGTTSGEAAALQFEIASATYDRYRQQIAELKASAAVPDPIGMVVGAAAFEQNMGTASTGGFPRIASMLLGGAGKSPGEIPGLALGGAEAAITGKFIGLGPQEVLAATATISKATGNPQEGGMYAKNLFKGIDEGIRKGLLKPGRTLPQYMQDIAALEATGKADFEIVGNDLRAFSGYRMLKAGMKEGTYATAASEIKTGVDTNLFGTTLEMYKVDPAMVGARALQASTAQLEQQQANAGTWSSLAQAVQKDVVRKRALSGGGTWAQWAEGKSQGFARWLSGDEAYVRTTFRAAQNAAEFGGNPPISDDLSRQIYEAAQAMKELRDATLGVRDAQRQKAAANVQPE